MSLFNQQNGAWKTGVYPLFLGEALALYDSINTPYPQLFDLYKLQKSMDWSEDEVNLEQSRMDLLQCSKSNYDVMLKNLAFQWELDSVASRAIAPLFAPFITNSELWAMFSKQSEIENLHALTYSEIIRQCIADPKLVFDEVMSNRAVLDRSDTVIKAFEDLKIAGAKYTLGLLKDEVALRAIILKALVALYCLEKLEFMSSFAATFALAEQGLFQGIAKLIQKIAQDEQVHCMMDEAVLKIVLSDPKWQASFIQEKVAISQIVDEVVQQELTWNAYLFSEGRSIVGLNKMLLDEWVWFNAQDIYQFLALDNPHPEIKYRPLAWMENWLDLNKTQNANQEADNNNYSLNTVLDDVDDDVLSF